MSTIYVLGRTAALVLSAALTITVPCSNEAFGADSKAKANATQPTTALNKTNSKSITQVSPWALSVLEKECPNIVEPYKLSSNTEIVAAFAQGTVTAKAKGLLSKTIGKIPLLNRKKDNNEPETETPKQELNGVREDVRNSLKQLNWLPMSTEVKYGAKQHATMTGILGRTSSLGKKYYPAADKMLSQLLGELDEEHEYKFQVFILKNSTRNAVARPGGYLYLDQGLLDNPEYLGKAYFAVAHEVSHVLRRHETKTLQSLVIDSFKTEESLESAFKNIDTDPDKVLDQLSFSKDMYARHHIDQELQADSCATRMLSKVFPDQKELGKVLDSFISDLPPSPEGKAEKEDKNLIQIVTEPVGSHPNSQERIKNLRTMHTNIFKKDASS